MRRSGVKEQAWVPGWTLSIKKTLQHPQSFCLGVQENVPHLEMFPKCLQSRVLEIQFIALRQKLDQVLISEIKHPCLSPRGKKKKKNRKQKQNTSNTELKSMYTSKILKTAKSKRQNLRSQWNTFKPSWQELVRKKRKKTNITLSNIHTVTKHYGIACINIGRLLYITYTRSSWLTDSEGYRCRKFLRPKSNIIQISQALHFNISGIMLVFL